MTEFGRFLVKHLDVLVVGFSCLVSIILLFVRKRPLARSFIQYVEFVCNEIPRYILEAERSGLHGQDKKKIVLSSCFSSLNRLIKCDEQDIEFAKTIFDQQIEKVLETPRKK